MHIDTYTDVSVEFEAKRSYSICAKRTAPEKFMRQRVNDVHTHTLFPVQVFPPRWLEEELCARKLFLNRTLTWQSYVQVMLACPRAP